MQECRALKLQFVSDSGIAPGWVTVSYINLEFCLGMKLWNLLTILPSKLACSY